MNHRKRQTLPRSLLAPRYWSAWLGVALVWLMAHIPRVLRHALGRAAGRLACRTNAKRRHIVDTNLKMCFPTLSGQQREDLREAAFESLGRSLSDLSLIWFASERRLRKVAVLEGWEHVECARENGKGVILHAAHCVGLEFGVLSVSLQEPAIGYYNPFKNPVLDWFALRGRQRFGNTAISRGEGMRRILRALRSGQIQYALTDEDYGEDASVFAPFFGNMKATLPISARLAALGNADVLPITTLYDEQRHCYVTKIFPALEDFPDEDMAQSAAKLNQGLEKLVSLAPQEYLWIQQLFKTQPDGQRVYQR